MLRRKKRKTAVARFCGDCGYELAPDGDGTCPMCAKFAQLRAEFVVPRPSELNNLPTRRFEPIDRGLPVDSLETAPTVSEYNTVVAAHRARAGSPGRSGGTVIRNPALRRIPASAQPMAPSHPRRAASRMIPARAASVPIIAKTAAI